mmetsp:Transcript_38078/g.87799  ORF Transcript_38078/g.87799 Transcript_38078/m.87799 type:complete len:214 (-) Transcript_38078:2222-2863(-)
MRVLARLHVHVRLRRNRKRRRLRARHGGQRRGGLCLLLVRHVPPFVRRVGLAPPHARRVVAHRAHGQHQRRGRPPPRQIDAHDRRDDRRADAHAEHGGPHCQPPERVLLAFLARHIEHGEGLPREKRPEAEGGRDAGHGEGVPQPGAPRIERRRADAGRALAAVAIRRGRRRQRPGLAAHPRAARRPMRSRLGGGVVASAGGGSVVLGARARV